ncbi:MAG: zinc ribbon domain-containing protein [Phycisphaerales bacterium]|nr:zinc ribbon domain-containing protein [Phycisphaerales bacterium]
MPDATAKICIICRQDCSNRPRVKDAKGRYLCKSCEQARAKRETAPAGAAASPGPDSDPDSNPFDLMPDSLLSDGPAPCPACNQPIPAGSVLCLHCGFDVRKGARLLTGTGVDDPDDPSSIPVKGKPAAAKCPDCGYDLTGLKSPRCPECGKLVVKKGYREKLAEDSKRAARDVWTKPLGMIAAGVVGIGIWELLADHTGRGLAESLLGIAIQVPIGLLVYFICCLLWIGFDMPWRYITLRLAAVYAITGLVSLPVNYIPIGVVRLGIMVIVYIGLLMDMLDLELQDAAIVAVLTVLANVFIAFTIAVYLAGLL